MPSESLFFRGVRQGSDAEAVAANQRARLLDAMARVVVRKGYARTTVADVVELASVSRRTFYEQFTDKEGCFLAAYATGTEIVLADIGEAVRRSGSRDWTLRLRIALEAYTGTLAAEPDLARLFLLDILGAGPAAIELRRRVLASFADMFRGLRAIAAADDPEMGEVSDTHLMGLVGAINELVCEQIAEHGADTLPDIAGSLEDFAHAILLRSRHTTRN